MVTMKKGTKTKQVPDWDVKGQIKNGWAVDNAEVRATLRPTKKNADETPAVEIASEQGDDDKANLEENENE